MKKILLFLLILPICIFAQQREVFRIDSLPKEGVLLNKGWKWHAGDNPEWAKPEYDDTKWEDIDPTKEVVQLPNISTKHPLWLRLKLKSQSTRNYNLSISQSGASEIYLNGKLIQKIGQIDPNNQHTHAYNPLDGHLSLKLDSLDNTLAIRYYFQPGLNLDPIYNIQYHLFSARIFDSMYIIASHNSYFWPGFNIGIAFILFFIHGVLFLYYPPLRANLWFSAWAFMNILFSYFLFQLEINSYLERNAQYVFFALLTSFISLFCLLYCQYLLLENKRTIYIYLFVASAFAHVIGYYYFNFSVRDILWLVLNLFQALLVVVMALDANRAGDRRGMPVLYGTMAYVVFWGLFSLSYPLSWSQTSKDILFHLATLSFPVTMSALLGFKFRQVNQSLLHNLEQVNQLYAEKQQILAAQNETLEKQVLERTTELEYKNRDLEIEAALERVRSRTMGMYQSSEVKEVASTLYEQLRHLGFEYGAVTILIVNAKTGDMEWWIAGFEEMQFPESYFITNFDHPVHNQMIQGLKSGEDFIVIPLNGESKKSYDEGLFLDNGFQHLPQRVKDWMLKVESVIFSLAFNRHGALHWGPTPLNEEQTNILIKFSKVFEQTYTRFLDLQKAEAQSKEAQIEAALERVRSASLAMHYSQELDNVVAVLFEKLVELGIPFDGACIYYFEKEKRDAYLWVISKFLLTPVKVSLPYDEEIVSNPIFEDLWKAIENKESIFNKSYTGQIKNDYFLYVAHYNQAIIPDEIKKFHQEADAWAISLVPENNSILGFDSWSGHKTSETDFQILKRFARVFEQAYTRFLDLQKAEAQTREAQIEAALERVRSRALAMQTTKEVNSVIGKIFTECKALDIQLDSSIIIIYDKQTLDTNWYLTNLEAPDYPACFSVPYNEYPFNTAMLHAWHQKTLDWGYVLDVQEKKEWDQFIYSKTDFVLLPDHIKEVMAAVEKLYIKAAFNEFGCIMLTSLTPLSDEQMAVLPRFSKVFELTYTRFKDLKIAEAQAEQAKLDLIQIQTEKKKAEDTLIELRATQTQLIQSEKLASLGELTAGIAHEIQNPLNFVNNFAEVSAEILDDLKADLQNGKTTEAIEIADDLQINLQKINHHGQRASSIVKGMLEHSRTSTGVKEPTDLNELADEFLRLAYHGLRAKDSSFNATMETHFDPDLPKISVIPQDIGRVLLNLINNAFYAVNQRKNARETLQATSLPYQPTVTVTTKKLENAIQISVHDNGNGIPDNIKDKIFQPFFTTKPSGQGTGLGLSLAYDIIKAHSGTLEVHSLPEESSTFIIVLPN